MAIKSTHAPGEVKRTETDRARTLWRETPVPWEMELFTLAILVFGIVFCVRYEWANIPEYARTAEVIELETTRNAWVILSVIAYAGHLLLSRVALRDVSTPFHLMVSPSLFALLGFFNFRGAFIRCHGVDAWMFPWSGFVLFIGSVAALSFLLARVRMQRVMLPFRDLRWDIDVAPRRLHGKEFGSLFMRVHPMIYPPVRYRANQNGIEIEGPYYVSLMSYREISSITHRPHGDVMAAGIYLTKSMNDLVQIKLKTQTEPILIGPYNAKAFADYSRRRLHQYEVLHSVGHTTNDD